MKDPFIIRVLRKIYKSMIRYEHPFFHANYPSRVLSAQDSNDLISQKLLGSEPFMVTRLGLTELSAVINYLEIQNLQQLNDFSRLAMRIKGFHLDFSDEIKQTIEQLSGVFPTDSKSLERFCKLYLDSFKSTDCLGVWNLNGEAEVITKFSPRANLIPLQSIEPYYFEYPWSSALNGKRILIIHPFKESIESQLTNRRKLFKNSDVLPDAEYIVIQAVQSISGNRTPYNSWFEALDYMVDKIEREDFDLAIIGAGAYGLPLAAHIKSMGKNAIHMGGPTQILFGIRGKRWDDLPFFQKLYNENWIYPNAPERPKNANMVEDACYW
jgi:hypothetical protein